MDWLLFSLGDLPHNHCPFLSPAAVNSRQMILCLMRGLLCTLHFCNLFGSIWVEWEFISMTVNEMELHTPAALLGTC